MGVIATPANATWSYDQYMQGSTSGSAGEMTWFVPGGWTAGRGPAGHPTGATAGTPGTWTPAPPASVPPWDASQANSWSITATPSTAWTTGQYVRGGAGAGTGDMHWNGTTWVAGQAP